MCKFTILKKKKKKTKKKNGDFDLHCASVCAALCFFKCGSYKQHKMNQLVREREKKKKKKKKKTTKKKQKNKKQKKNNNEQNVSLMF